jgi:hypothetical protein
VQLADECRHRGGGTGGGELCRDPQREREPGALFDQRRGGGRLLVDAGSDVDTQQLVRLTSNFRSASSVR